VASFFVSRVDTEIDRRLDRTGGESASALRGRAAIANARIAYEHYQRMLATDRWQQLEGAGVRPQRLLWASTGVKDPAYEDTRYVVDLVAPNVVNTMPEATLSAFADHGVLPAGHIRDTYAEAHQVLEDLADAGVDYGDVVQVLEDQGVETFDASWDELAGKLTARLHASSSARPGRTDDSGEHA
jgi:transaldolase